MKMNWREGNECELANFRRNKPGSLQDFAAWI